MATRPEDLPRNFTFAPTEEFSWARIATYYPGNTYNCSELPRHDALREKCAEWLDAGKIIVTPVAGFTVTETTINAGDN